MAGGQARVNVRMWAAWARGCERRTQCRTRARSLRSWLELLRDQLGAGAGRRGRLVAARPLRTLAAAAKCRQSAVAAALSVKMLPPPPSLAPYIDQAEKFLLIKSGPAQSNPDPMIKSASSSYSGKDKNQDFMRINKHTSIGPRGRLQKLSSDLNIVCQTDLIRIGKLLKFYSDALGNCKLLS